jgi:hypothetical protein
MTLPTPSITIALNAFIAAVAAVPSIANASSTDLIPIQAAGVVLQNALSAAAAVEDAEILANPLATPDGGLTSLLATLEAMQAESDYLNSQYYFGRATVNVQNDLG